jgi:hypothetical protein
MKKIPLESSLEIAKKLVEKLTKVVELQHGAQHWVGFEYPIGYYLEQTVEFVDALINAYK